MACAIGSCSKPNVRGLEMCGLHWMRVSAPTQQEVRNSWRAFADAQLIPGGRDLAVQHRDAYVAALKMAISEAVEAEAGVSA